ncbi:MAG TPA: DAK2 domain-containing protein [Anaerolineae bacterium]
MMESKASTSADGYTPLLLLDGVEVKQLWAASTAWLERHAPFVNSLNVFPVPDGDSGTNMLLTMQAAMREVERSPEHSTSGVCNALSHGALLGARGNSGVILSQIVRGFARSVGKNEVINAMDFAQGLSEGSLTAYKGVVKPVEGTILTVVREAAEAALKAAEGSTDIRRVLDETVRAARLSLARTPDLLPVLKKAGVVDAGGQGLVIILEGALKYLRGERIERATPEMQAQNLQEISREEGWGYDIQFHIRGRSLNVEKIRETIAEMGESALVVGDESLLKVHVHAPNPGEIVKFGAEQGALVNVIIENMQEQYVDFMAGGRADKRVGAENLGGAGVPLVVPPIKVEDVSTMCTIATAAGTGVKNVFTSLGVSAIIDGGQTNNPSTQDILNAIESVGTKQVIVLPNNKNIILSANQAKDLSDKQVAIVPTKTIPQGISALLAFNFQADLDTNVQAMMRAAESVRTLEVTRATRSVSIDGVDAKEGQFIGLIDGELAGAADDRPELINRLLERMSARDAEVITVYYGQPVDAGEAEKLALSLQAQFNKQTIELHNGGQPVYYYIISVE